MARTGQDAATMFLVDRDNPGMRYVRTIDTIDHGASGGHGELEFDDCQVGQDAVLGAVDEGFRYAQVRLGPARLTHCMRWLGAARRCHETAVAYAARREMFGGRSGDLGMTQQAIADNEIDIAASRALIWQAAYELDCDRPARSLTSIAKTFVAEATFRIADRSVQMCGALGISADAPVGRLFNEIRPFRIYDGPSEVHRWSIARRALRRLESGQLPGDWPGRSVNNPQAASSGSAAVQGSRQTGRERRQMRHPDLDVAATRGAVYRHRISRSKPLIVVYGLRMLRICE
jgi:acyl-CoA dehydrogenase